jgi:predicted transcriptional regulator
MIGYDKLMMAIAPLLMMEEQLPVYRPSRSERMVSSASIEALMNEFNLINHKQSKLTSRQREMVKGRVEYLVEKGHLVKLEDGSVSIRIELLEGKH